MLVCSDCHEKRQMRQSIEMQPLQFTGYMTTSRGCADCGSATRFIGVYEYSNAYELMVELGELKGKLLDLPDACLDQPLYHDAEEVLRALELRPDEVLSNADLVRAVIKYAAEMEKALTALQ